MVGGWVGDQCLDHGDMSSWAAWGGRRSAGFAQGFGRGKRGKREGKGPRGCPGIEQGEELERARERSGALNGDWRMGEEVHRMVAEGMAWGERMGDCRVKKGEGGVGGGYVNGLEWLGVAMSGGEVESG